MDERLHCDYSLVDSTKDVVNYIFCNVKIVKNLHLITDAILTHI